MKSEQQVTRETILCGSKKDAERMVEVIKSRARWVDPDYKILPYEDRFYLHIEYIWLASTELDRIQTLEKENAELETELSALQTKMADLLFLLNDQRTIKKYYREKTAELRAALRDLWNESPTRIMTEVGTFDFHAKWLGDHPEHRAVIEHLQEQNDG